MGIKAPRLKKKQSKRWAKHDSIDNPCKKCPKLVGGFNPATWKIWVKMGIFPK